MEKDTIKDLFEGLKGEFDINEPKSGHENRFLDKLREVGVHDYYICNCMFCLDIF